MCACRKHHPKGFFHDTAEGRNSVFAMRGYWKKRHAPVLASLEFYRTHHPSFLNRVLIWPGFNVCFKLMHHNEKSWPDYSGRSFLDLAEPHCFHNFNEDT